VSNWKENSMNEHLTGAMSQRLQALHMYAMALKHGDIERFTAVLHAAESDPALERLLLEFNEATLQEGVAVLRPEDFKRAEEYLRTVQPFTGSEHWLHEPVSSHSRDLSENQETHFAERESIRRVLPGRSPLFGGDIPPSSRPPARSSRSGTRLQSLVALLIVGLLLGAFGELFATHHRPFGIAATPSPRSTAATIAPSIHPRGIVVLGSATGVVLGLRAENGNVLWRYHASSSIDALVVQNQVVYFQTDNGDVVALRIKDGTRLWNRDFGQFQGSPTHIFVDQGVVLVPDVRDTYALRATDGKILWRYQHTETSIQGSLNTGAVEPLGLGDGIAYIFINQPPSAPGMGWSNRMIGMRATDGTVLWQYGARGDDYPDDAVVAGGIVYVFVSSVSTPLFLAMRATDGHLIWSQRTTVSQQFVKYLVNHAGISLTTTNMRVCQRRIGDGTLVWCTPRLITMDGSLVVMNDTVYIGVLLSDADYELLAFRATDGTTRWSWHTRPDSNYVGEIYLGLSGVLYVVTPSGINALDGASGVLLWHTNPGSGQLVIAGGS
jgi:outer membrane protein assembly factor BamB